MVENIRRKRIHITQRKECFEFGFLWLALSERSWCCVAVVMHFLQSFEVQFQRNDDRFVAVSIQTEYRCGPFTTPQVTVNELICTVWYRRYDYDCKKFDSWLPAI